MRKSTLPTDLTSVPDPMGYGIDDLNAAFPGKEKGMPMTETGTRITNGDVPAFLMCPPLFLSADTPNNVWMREMSEEERRIDRGKAFAQFQSLYSFLAARAIVYLLPSRPGLQDQVYTANLAAVLPHREEKMVVISSFRSTVRRAEQQAGVEFFSQMSVPFVIAPEYFEGEADLKHICDNVYVGAHGQRTSLNTHNWFQETFDMEVIPFEIDNEYLYHLDCSIFRITRQEMLVCTAVTGEETLAEIEKYVSIIDVELDDADSGITNCVRIGDYVLCASNIEELALSHRDYAYEKHKIGSLERICSNLGLTPKFFNLSEFLKSGAMLSCLIMHLNHNNH